MGDSTHVSADEALRVLRQGQPAEVRHRVLEGFHAWLSDSSLSDDTLGTYWRRIRVFLDWVGATAERDNAFADGAGRDRAVRAFTDEMVIERNLADSTINVSLRAVDIFYAWLGLGPAAAPRVLLTHPPLDTLDRRQLSTLLRAASGIGHREYALIVLMLDLGLSSDQVLALRRRDIRLGHRHGRVRCPDAHGRPRWAMVQASTAVVLRNWRLERRALCGRRIRAFFITRHPAHGALSERGLHYIVQRIGRGADLQVSPRTLRNTARTRIAREIIESDHTSYLPGPPTSRVPTPAVAPPQPRRKPARPARPRRANTPKGQLRLDFGSGAQ